MLAEHKKKLSEKTFRQRGAETGLACSNGIILKWSVPRDMDGAPAVSAIAGTGCVCVCVCVCVRVVVGEWWLIFGKIIQGFLPKLMTNPVKLVTF